MSSTNQISLIALIDCNNFYVSCERFINPALREKPLVVLSNNDGCIVSRSNEAKALGIPMGAPYFKYKKFMEANGIEALSSNYALYADLSKRVMDTIAHFMPEIEIYSVDEAFTVFYGSPEQIESQAREIRKTVLRWTGIPVSVGLAPTKTLAKAANEIAKKTRDSSGVKLFCNEPEWQTELTKLPVHEVWGVGRKLSKRLNEIGIFNALQLSGLSDERIKEKFNVVLQRTVWELKGKACLKVKDYFEPSKSIVSSRSFGKPITSFDQMSESVATYISRAAEKLRKQGLVTQYVHVYITTNRFKPEEPQYSNSIAIKLPTPSDYTPTLIEHAIKGLKQIYREGYQYKKSAVMFSFLLKKEEIQRNLLDPCDPEKEARLMKTIDQVNARLGANTLKFAATGTDQEWKMRSEKRSKKATSSIKELLVVKA